MFKLLTKWPKKEWGESKFLKILKNKYLLVTLFFLVWVFFFDTNNLISWYSDLHEVIEQENQKKYYKEAIIKTEEKFKELSSNRDSLEKFAREQYFFHDPSEELFIIRQK
jgi:cell division protein DivIC